MKKRKNNKTGAIIGLTISALLLVGTGTLAYLTKGFQDWTFKQSEVIASDNLATSLKTENGITLKVKKAQSDTGYGSQIIQYIINPEFYTDNVKYKINYNDGTAVADDILKIVQDTANNQITITCNKVFNKKIILTIYAESNANVKAEVNIDFIEKITPTFNLQATDGQPLKVINNVETTGGTITVDKTVKEESFTFNAEFLTKAKNYLKEDSYEFFKNHRLLQVDGNKEYYFPEGLYYQGSTSEEYFNTCTFDFSLESINPSSISNYSQGNFLSKLYLNVGFTNVDLFDGDTDTDVLNYAHALTFKIEASALSKTHFNELFNGTTNVFDYSCKINNQIYTKSFGLSIDEVNISSISTNKTNISF